MAVSLKLKPKAKDEGRALPGRRPPPPRVWLLTSGRAGDTAELKTLAEGLGWPYECKELAYNRLSRLPNTILGPSLISLKDQASIDLKAPWPDLVITRGWHSAPVARWIRRQSKGKTRVVVLGQPRAPLHYFDLVIASWQYRLPERDNVMLNALPLNRVDPQRTEDAIAVWRPKLRHMHSPLIGVLVGGNNRPAVFDAETAARLGRAVNNAARRMDGSLLITSGPRTGGAALDALASEITVPAHIHRWRAGDTDNPYPAFLALADAFIVTADSIAMIAEACATRKPVAVFELPQRPDWRVWLAWRFWRWTEGTGWPLRLRERLVDTGLITSTGRDHCGYLERLRAASLITTVDRLDVSSATPSVGALEETLDRLVELMGRERSDAYPADR